MGKAFKETRRRRARLERQRCSRRWRDDSWKRKQVSHWQYWVVWERKDKDEPGDRARLSIHTRDHQALVLGRTGRLEEQVDDELVRQDHARRLIGVEERGGFEDVVLRLRRRREERRSSNPFREKQKVRTLTMVPQAVRIQPSSSRYPSFNKSLSAISFFALAGNSFCSQPSKHPSLTSVRLGEKMVRSAPPGVRNRTV